MGGLSKSILAFNDCKAAFERALDSPKGTRFTFADPVSAKAFQRRCYQFRKLDRAENSKIYTEPAHTLHGRSVFDTIMIRARGNVVFLERIIEAFTNVEDIE